MRPRGAAGSLPTCAQITAGELVGSTAGNTRIPLAGSARLAASFLVSVRSKIPVLTVVSAVTAMHLQGGWAREAFTSTPALVRWLTVSLRAR